MSLQQQCVEVWRQSEKNCRHFECKHFIGNILLNQYTAHLTANGKFSLKHSDSARVSLSSLLPLSQRIYTYMCMCLYARQYLQPKEAQCAIEVEFSLVRHWHKCCWLDMCVYGAYLSGEFYSFLFFRHFVILVTLKFVVQIKSGLKKKTYKSVRNYTNRLSALHSLLCGINIT